MDHSRRSPEKHCHTIYESERSATRSPTPMQKPRRFWEKLGICNIAVLSIGTIAIIVALIVLYLIWGAVTYARYHSFPLRWYKIILLGWATRAVTLCSILIRVATAAQLGVFAAILAALILEHVGVATETLPLVSMIRCLNSGPHSLAMSILDSIFTKALFPYSILIVLAIMNAFALQFTSTMLLSDFKITDIVMDEKTNVSFGLNRNVATNSHTVSTGSIDSSGPNTYEGLDYWKTGPYMYQRFAEYRESGSTGNNYIDTGKTLRGFPPLHEDLMRYSLRHYEGPMMVVDTRVVCVKPTVSNLTMEARQNSIKGNFSSEHTHPDIKPASALEGFGSEVNCTLPFSDYYTESQWATSLCTIGDRQARLSGGITANDDDPDYPDGHTSAHLLLNVTGSFSDWNVSLPQGAQLQQIESSEPMWTRYGQNNVSIDFSLCFVNPLPWSYSVTAMSDRDGADRAFLYNVTTKTYDTSDLRAMYGATAKSLTLVQREQLELKSKSNWTASRVDNVYKMKANDFIWDTLGRINYASYYSDDESAFDGVGSTTMFTQGAVPEFSVHRSHAALYQDIIQDTRNPALSLQALFTVLLQMAYYDFLYEYDLEAPVEYRYSDKLDIPRQWRALGAISALLVLHFLLLLIALRMFLTRTEMSLLGNAWQAVSQVVSTDTADVLHHGATTTDREVKGSMKQSGIADGRIRIAKSATSGRTEAAAVRQRQDATYTAPISQV
jgi:hypothetical protein